MFLSKSFIKKKYFSFLIFFIIFLAFDFIFTLLFFKQTILWNQIDQKFFKTKDWRIQSSLYHHDIAQNVNVEETWGHLKYKLITNSIGFRDFTNKLVLKENFKKKRIYVNGDSFVEGVGYDYKDTVIGLLAKKLSNNYEILNSAVTSYSPSIYFRKTKHYINKGFIFDYCIIFLDVSDIADENFINEDENGHIYDLRQRDKETSFKGKVYKISRFYRDNFISGKFIALSREKIGKYKSKIKKRYLASKKFNLSFFKIGSDEINLYKSINIDRSSWTYNEKYSKRWKNVGLSKSSKYLKKLILLLKQNDIKYYLVIYPNPGQIFSNKENIHENYWIEWAKNNNVQLINLYKLFTGENKKQIIKRYFIPGDVHWNINGHELVYNELKMEIIDKF